MATLSKDDITKAALKLFDKNNALGEAYTVRPEVWSLLSDRFKQKVQADLEAAKEKDRVDWVTKVQQEAQQRAAIQKYYEGTQWIGVDFAKGMVSADPDGPLVPLPSSQPAPRVLNHPAHDFTAALYRPWVPVA